ncbi:MAG: hypothetical protein HQK49_16565 [Oligoflexia bacterium]|nr:hypothetical protein [Oligoflexia bacterium]
MPLNNNNNKNRTYKLKNPSLEFYCPLCSQKRYVKYRSKLSNKNYLQLSVASLFAVSVLFPYVKQKSMDYTLIIVFVFAMWCCYEMIIKLFHRKELPCPHCGFDMTWYRRDVRMAKKLVKDFWQNKNSQQQQDQKEQITPATTTPLSTTTTTTATATATLKK